MLKESKTYWDKKFKEQKEIWGRSPSKGAILVSEDLKKINRINDKRLLDIGCGYGRDVKFFFDLGLKAKGIDFSYEAIKLGREIWPEIDIIEGDIFNYDFNNERFDIIFCNFLIHLLDESHRKILINHIYYNLLSKDGILYATVSSEDDIDFKNEEKVGFNLVKNARGVVKFFYNSYLIDKEFGIFPMIEKKVFKEEHTHDFNHIHTNWFIKCSKNGKKQQIKPESNG